MITMLEQKQIEEMSEDVARMLCEIYRPNCDEYQPHSCSKCYVNSTPIGCFVEMLYEAGYRKQSEWISVDDRLPEVRQRVLLYSHHDGVNTGYRADEIGRFYVDKSYPYRPTHWMPLPEAPKGGAE